MKIVNIVLLVIIVLTFACTGGKKVTTGTTQNCLPTELDFEAFQNSPKDPFEIKEAMVDGDCLKIRVTYGGGCGGARFQLVGDQTLTKAVPAGRLYLLRLSLDDKDYCRSIVDSTMHFNLKNLRDPEAKAVSLRLRDWEENMEYNY